QHVAQRDLDVVLLVAGHPAFDVVKAVAETQRQQARIGRAAHLAAEVHAHRRRCLEAGDDQQRAARMQAGAGTRLLRHHEADARQDVLIGVGGADIGGGLRRTRRGGGEMARMTGDQRTAAEGRHHARHDNPPHARRNDAAGVGPGRASRGACGALCGRLGARRHQPEGRTSALSGAQVGAAATRTAPLAPGLQNGADESRHGPLTLVDGICIPLAEGL
ncbi:conserved hypothetical protein, partial [Ricinus communis]